MGKQYALLARDGTILWATRNDEIARAVELVGAKAWQNIADRMQSRALHRAFADAIVDDNGGPVDVEVNGAHLRITYSRIDGVAVVAKSQRIAVVRLTPRELDVLRMLCASVPLREAAAQLGIGISSFETHRRNLLRKTGCRGPGQLALWARDRGLV